MNPDIGKYRRDDVVWGLKKKWVIRYDDTWRVIMKEVAKELGVPLEDVERINTAWWKFVGEMLYRVDMPRIRMMYLVNMYPSVKKLHGYCDKMSVVIEGLCHGVRVMNRPTGDVGAMRKHLVKLHDTYFRILEEGKDKVPRAVNCEMNKKKNV